MLLRIKSLEKFSLLEALSEFYSAVYSSAIASILINATRRSTSRQYESVWGKFCDFIRVIQPTKVDCKFVLLFFEGLFSDKGLAPATISTYKSALARPLKLFFDVDVSVSPFQDFMKGLFNLKPSMPYKSPSWSLEKALSLALSARYQINPSLEDLLKITLFLVALATGGRVSELHALLRGPDYIDFCEGGVRLFPNPNFLAKNESPSVRRDPIFINNLLLPDGMAHPLCPVHTIKKYLLVTEASNSFKLFVNPVSLLDLSLFKLRFFICRFIREADPGSFPKTHDLRKYASSFAFFRGMDISNVCNLVGWSSFRIFKKHYLKPIKEVKSSLVVLGSRFPGSARVV